MSFQDSEIKEVVRSSVESPDSVGNLLYLTVPSLYAVKQTVSKAGGKKRMTRGILNEIVAEGSAVNGAYSNVFILPHSIC